MISVKLLPVLGKLKVHHLLQLHRRKFQTFSNNTKTYRKQILSFRISPKMNSIKNIFFYQMQFVNMYINTN